MYVINADDCLGCEICVFSCPCGAISMQDYVAVIDASLCIGCGGCALSCGNQAIIEK